MDSESLLDIFDKDDCGIVDDSCFYKNPVDKGSYFFKTDNFD